MLSYTSVDSATPLLEETIGSHFERIAAQYPDRDALIEVESGLRYTYARLNAEIDRVALGLLATGVAAGERIGIWAPNCAQWTILQYATAKIGAILVNVNPAYRAAELEFAVNQCGMRMLVTAGADRNSNYPAMARAALSACPTLRELVFIDADQAGADLNAGIDVKAADDVVHGPQAFAFESLAARSAWITDRQALAARMAELAASDPINIQYTSGTTGYPKGATLTHHNILNNGYFIGELLNYTHEDRVVIPVPFYHCFGMVIGNLNIYSRRGCAILPGRSFSAAATLAAVQEYGGTSLYGVPTMFIAELALENFAEYDLSTLRTGVMAGSTCPVEVMKRVIGEMNMRDVAICYGMTETSPVSTMTRDDDSITRRTETVGRTMPHLESQVVDPISGEAVQRGQIGELCTRGYAVMSGYWNQPEKTAEAVDPQGWMHTGDLAVMDEDGYLRVEGRIKDMVIRGGENVYPREIEEFLYRHRDIQDVQVIGVPDAKYGEELLAYVILKPGAPLLTAEALAEFCRGKLSHYKIPRYIEVTESFPMTVSGKIRKVEMRAAAVAKLSLAGGCAGALPGGSAEITPGSVQARCRG